MLHMHKWGDWKSKGRIRTYGDYSDLPETIVETYVGTCTVCGMIKFKKVKL
jgi:hypothetical protein